MKARKTAFTASEIASFSWPKSRIAELVEALAKESNLRTTAADGPAAGYNHNAENQDVGSIIAGMTTRLGLQAQLVDAPYAEVDDLLSHCAPAILPTSTQNGHHLLAMIASRRSELIVLGPDYKRRTIKTRRLSAFLRREVELPVLAEIDSLLDEASVPRKRRAKAHASLLKRRLTHARPCQCWLLRHASSADFRQQLRANGIPQRIVAFFATHIMGNLLWIASWWIIGKGALQGRLDFGWLGLWVLVLGSMLPFQMATTWLRGTLAIKTGALLRQRLLAGTLKLEPEELRRQGVGHFLGRVIETETVQALALDGGLSSLTAIVELILAWFILLYGAGGWPHAALLTAWILLAAILWRRFYIQRRRWTTSCLDLTHELIEKMVGHRTRLAQEPRAEWHEEEDESLSRYVNVSEEMDKTHVWFSAFIPRGWLLLGLIGLTPAFVFQSSAAAQIAVSLGGILFAFRAFQEMSMGLTALTSAALSWNEISQIFHAAARPTANGSLEPVLSSDSGDGECRAEKQAVLTLHNVVFHHDGRHQPVLANCDLRISEGDRILLEGDSGSGKSTLSALMTGLRSPSAGLVLLRGLDFKTVGAANWRRGVTAAPQFHENHVFSGTFAFNLLMGRHWPPRREDLEEAAEVCKELGLGDLLERMPGRLQQMVGETGWQLSNGEKTRLFIARALLQQSELIILDESFAALDSESLQQCVETASRRSRTLVVIAHP